MKSFKRVVKKAEDNQIRTNVPADKTTINYLYILWLNKHKFLFSYKIIHRSNPMLH